MCGCAAARISPATGTPAIRTPRTRCAESFSAMTTFSLSGEQYVEVQEIQSPQRDDHGAGRVAGAGPGDGRASATATLSEQAHPHRRALPARRRG
ncbi:hypothetical protein G6F22_021712 [Rhizopus arrhizus]|nr:hypothetical protein G6F22_021712 [Rhizopus arrhizus]